MKRVAIILAVLVIAGLILWATVGGGFQGSVEDRLEDEMVAAGLPQPMAECMAGRMADRLSIDQLRKLVQPHERIGVIGGGHTGMVVTMHLTERVGAHCTQLFIRRPIRLASWDSTQQSYVSWAFRGLKGKAARFALDHGLAELEPPNGAVGDGSLGLELHHSSQLHSCKATASGLDAVVYCLGFGAPPMPTVRSGNSTVSISGHQVPGGALLDARRRPVPGLFGCGLGFSDSEYTSGAAYGVAGFMPFAMRAREIARQVATS